MAACGASRFWCRTVVATPVWCHWWLGGFVAIKSGPGQAIPVQRRLSFQFFLISLAVFSLGVIICDAQLLLTSFSRPDPAQADLLIASLRSSFFPEPLERISFLACLVLLPPLLFWHVNRQPGCEPMRRLWFPDRLDLILCLLTAGLLAIPLLLPLLGAYGGLGGAGFAISVLLAGFGLLALGMVADRWRLPARQRRMLKQGLLAFCSLCIVLSLISFRVFSFAEIHGDDGFWSIHLEAVSSAVSQVMAGRTLLVHIPSQYGLFPVLLAPILQILPAGVAGLTLAFALLQVVSLLALLVVLHNRLRSPFLLACSSLTLLLISFGTFQLFGLSKESVPDPYFQYWPIRFFAPALSVPITFWVFRRFSRSRLAVLTAWISLSLFWNMDSGMAILYGKTMLFFILTLAGVCEDPPGRLRHLLPRLALAMVLVPCFSLALVAMGLGLLSLWAGHPLHWDWLFHYQSIFYGLGFMMMPMSSTPEIWQSVVAVYGISLLIGLLELRRQKSLASILPLLYLPLLGGGLFVYYQGRSSIGNLLSVSWPAVMLAGFLVDRHLRAVSRGLLSPRSLSLPIVGLAALLLPAWFLLRSVPLLVAQGSRLPFQPPHPHYHSPAFLASELAMVRENCSGAAGQCLLLLQRQGIYSLEAGTASLLEGPSPVEIILQSDLDRLVHQIRAGVPAKILLGIQPQSRVSILPLRLDDLAHYERRQTNREGTVLLLVRRPTGASLSSPAAVSGRPSLLR
jgi:hypothetical protein